MTQELEWFSARLRMLVTVAGEAHHFADSIHVFKASSWEAALLRAKGIGDDKGQTYKNDAGQDVHWGLHSVVTLDHVIEPLDGAEVFAESFDLEVADVNALDANQTEPRQTI